MRGTTTQPVARIGRLKATAASPAAGAQLALARLLFSLVGASGRPNLLGTFKEGFGHFSEARGVGGIGLTKLNFGRTLVLPAAPVDTTEPSFEVPSRPRGSRPGYLGTFKFSSAASTGASKSEPLKPTPARARATPCTISSPFPGPTQVPTHTCSRGLGSWSHGDAAKRLWVGAQSVLQQRPGLPRSKQANPAANRVDPAPGNVFPPPPWWTRHQPPPVAL